MTLLMDSPAPRPWKADEGIVLSQDGRDIVADCYFVDFGTGSQPAEQTAALIARAVNAHEILYRFMSDMCEHADTATREYALSIAAKLGEGDG